MIFKIEKFVEVIESEDQTQPPKVKEIEVYKDMATDRIEEIIGHSNVIAQTQKGPMQMPLHFPINAVTVESAIEMFDEAKENHIKMIEEYQKSAKSVYGPNGEPLGNTGKPPIQFPG